VRSLVTERNMVWRLNIAGYGAGILQMNSVRRRDSSVCIVFSEYARDFPLTETSRSPLGPTQPRDKWAAGSKTAGA